LEPQKFMDPIPSFRVGWPWGIKRPQIILGPTPGFRKGWPWNILEHQKFMGLTPGFRGRGGPREFWGPKKIRAPKFPGATPEILVWNPNISRAQKHFWGPKIFGAPKYPRAAPFPESWCGAHKYLVF
jgi:hypothetical protein